MQKFFSVETRILISSILAQMFTNQANSWTSERVRRKRIKFLVRQDLSFKLQIKKLLKNQFLIMIITCTIKLFKQLKRIELSINSAKNFTVIQTSILVKKSYIKFGILVRFSSCPCWEVFKNHILSSIMNLTTYINHTFFHENLPSLCKISEVWYQPQWQYLIFHWKV